MVGRHPARGTHGIHTASCCRALLKWAILDALENRLLLSARPRPLRHHSPARRFHVYRR